MRKSWLEGPWRWRVGVGAPGGSRLALALPCLLVAGTAAAAPARVLVDRVVAVVEGDIITQRELEALPAVTGAAAAGMGASGRRELWARALNAEIDERLLSRQVAALRDQLGVGESDVDRAIEEVRGSNQLTEPQLESALAAQGLTLGEYRAKLREQIERARAVQLRMQGRPEPGLEAVRQRCLTAGAQRRDRVRLCASHLLVPLAPEADAATRAGAWRRARALHGSLSAGGAWAQVLAAATAAGDGVQGGALGCFGRGEMVEDFEDAAYALEPGQHSEIVETPVGLHIIHLDRREEGAAAGCVTPEELEPHRQALHQEDMQRQLARWVEELRSRASIELRL